MLTCMANCQAKAAMTQTPPDFELHSAALPQAALPTHRLSLRLIVGIVLMAGSFLAYPAYPIILLWLPISAGTKTAVSVGVWVLSWSTFSLGAYLAGPQGYAWFKGLWNRVIKSAGGRSR